MIFFFFSLVDVEALKAQQTKGFAKMKGMFSKKKTVTPTAESVKQQSISTFVYSITIIVSLTSTQQESR